MEKRRPHYDLAVIQARVVEMGAAAFTKTALDGGRALGLTSEDMLEVIAALTHGDFYKSMTTIADKRMWQDVYHAMTQVEIEAYIKVTLREGAVVIQFKEK
jgi:motility quorum-sensing regulator/GCU-specific mRNA interferase toxin